MIRRKTGQMEQDFTAYEYKTVRAESESLSLLLDAYESFGWQLDERISDLDLSGDGASILRLRRDRKIMNQMELTRLQRNFEGCMEEITQLEKEKTKTATAAAIAVGIIGTAFLAGATFAVTAAQPLIVLCVILAVPGFLGWILPYFIYQRLKKKKTEEMNRLIGKKQDEISELMQKGHLLLHDL